MKDVIKAIYFDLDDTLCAYWDASKKALWQALEEASLPVSTESAFEAWRSVFPSFSREIKTPRWYERYLETGEPTRTEHMRRALHALGISDEDLAGRLSQRYADLRNQYLTLYPDVIPVLTELKELFWLGLITNGPADVQREEIRVLGIRKFFQDILIEGEVKVGKPNVRIFDLACEHSGYLPGEMLYVGNAFEHDVQGAKSAGWHAIWLNRALEENPNTHPQPDAILTDLYQLLEWLGLQVPEGTEKAPSQPARNWRSIS
ncbi:MAG: HAD family hydrolase [Fimbriimonadales bacterium]|nr:HAD family hydrolase [Fimbriimonadales bacterium]